MTHLAWQRLQKSDEAGLRAFVCSPPPPPIAKHKHRRVAGAYWERSVEAGIQSIRYPHPEDEIVLVGRDAEGVAAVSQVWERIPGQDYKWLAGAIALRCRKKRLGDELFDETKQAVLSRMDELGSGLALLWGFIHERNGDSLQMASRHRMQYLDTDVQQNLQRWAMPLDLRTGVEEG